MTAPISWQRLKLDDGRVAEIRIRYSRRARRLHLRLDLGDNVIELVMPMWRDINEGMAFARSKKTWIGRQLDCLVQAVPFADGVSLPLAGKQVTIRWRPDASSVPAVIDGDLVVGGPAHQLAGHVQSWLEDRAREEIRTRIEVFSGMVGTAPKAVRLGDTVSKWGSCSHDGRLGFSWRPVMAPPHVLDYLVAHEMAHLRIFDHSPGFWRLVARLCPDFEKSKRWLKRHGHRLHGYGRATARPAGIVGTGNDKT